MAMSADGDISFGDYITYVDEAPGTGRLLHPFTHQVTQCK